MSDKLGDFLGLPGSKKNSMLKALQANVKPDEELGIGEVMPPEAAPKIVSVEKEADFRKARKDIDHVISTGMESLENLASLAMASENPKAYDTVAKMMQVLVLASEKRVSLHAHKEEPQSAPNGGGVTQNNMFVGTTTDLLKMIKDKG